MQENPEDRETADEKRIRLAREYLHRVEGEAEGDSSGDEDGVERRLQQDSVSIRRANTWVIHGVLVL